MFPNRLKGLWAEGKPALNGWLSIGNAFTAEIMAAQGYDSLTVDMQHGALDYSHLLPMLQAMRASGTVPLARIPWREPGIAMKALDAGALGLICPMVNAAAEAAEFVSFLRYPPLGQRSFGPTRAGFAYGPAYAREANANILAFAMVETAEAYANLEAIAATPGLDGIYVGPSDLSLGLSQGRLVAALDREEPEMIEAIRRIAETCGAKGIVAGIHCGSAAYAHRAAGWGYRFVTVENDVRLLSAAAGASVADFRKLAGQGAAEGAKALY